MAYDVSNPHPGFGVDPNIINEFGHTHYPKFVEHKGQRVIVQDAKEEEALTGEVSEQPTKKKKPDEVWGK